MNRVCLSLLTLAFTAVAEGTCAVNESCNERLTSEHPEDDEMSLMQLPLQLNDGILSSGLNSTSKLQEETTTSTSTLHFGENESDFAKLTAVTLNDVGDLDALVSSIELDLFIVLGMFFAFMVLAKYYPMIYSFRATGGPSADGPMHWPADDYQWFRWVRMSLHVSVKQMIETCGLDCAMLLRFTSMSMEMMLLVGIPNFLILSMLYCFAGGNAAGKDHLSYLGINNVQYESWVFWPVAFMVWYNVVIIQYRLFQWQRTFIKYRFDWLFGMPIPQDTTLLVEGIEQTECSDAALKKFFEGIYGEDQIIEAFVVKRIKVLEGLIQEYKDIEQKLHEVEFFIEKNPDKPRPTFHRGEEKQPFYIEEKNKLTIQIKEEQKKVLEEAERPVEDLNKEGSSLYATNGFVTFKTRAKAEQALAIRLRMDDSSFVLSYAPDPVDVIYSDLEMTEEKQEAMQMIGYGLVAGLAVIYMPIIIGISDLTQLDKLRNVQILREIFDASPTIESLVAGQLPSLGLTFMTAMLPTFLMLIFTAFFYLVANRWAQYELQQYYFWFQVLFVILTTSIGSSLIDTLSDIVQSPFLIFEILADKMPLTTHFYMNFMVMQWTTQASNLLRIANLAKYLMFKRICEPDRARELSEPEDQDYYGMGSRSARFSINLSIGIIFGTMCPLITLFTFINFALSRLVFGYLLPFQEVRKDDLGGMFWVRQLNHVHISLFIYISLMIGLVSQRAANLGPTVVVAGVYLWWGFSWYKFTHKLRWEQLAFEELVKDQLPAPRKPTAAQPATPACNDCLPQDCLRGVMPASSSEPSEGSSKPSVPKRKSTRKTYRQIELEPNILEQIDKE